MINPLKSAGRWLLVAGVFALVAVSTPPATRAENVVKVVDLFTGQLPGGTPFGPTEPRCRFTLVGTNLWFTTYSGTASGAGGIWSFDPATSNVTELASLDNVTGNKPHSGSLVLAGGKAWFTTASGSIGGVGTLAYIETNWPSTPYPVTTAFGFPASGPIGGRPNSTPIQVGDDLWFTAASGGIAPNGATTYGTVLKYHMPSGTMTNALTMDGTNTGRQFIGNSLTKVGNTFYYLTFAGGTNTGFGTPNGAGVLGSFTLDSNTNVVYTKCVDLPGDATGRHIAFPGANLVWDGSNYLYFTTAGVTTNPGSISRYDILNNRVTNLFNFLSNSVARTNFGAQPYCTPVLYNGALYFTTLSGGTSNFGVIGKLNLRDNSVTKLADLERKGGLALGGQPQYDGGTLYTNPANGRVAIYWPINFGGIFGGNQGGGTIVRIELPPPPVITTAATTGEFVLLSWTGGYSPFSIDRTEDLSTGVWATNWLTGITSNSISIPLTGAQAFFRVVSTNQ